jgi:hypothetical protein
MTRPYAHPTAYDSVIGRRTEVLPQDVPGFAQVQLAVIEQDIGLEPLGEEGLREALRSVPFEWAFAWTARIDAQIRHGAQHDRRQRAQLEAVAGAFAGHPRQRELLELVASEDRALFSTSYLHVMQRLLVEEAQDGAEERAGDAERMQAAFLAMSNVVSKAESRPKGFDRDHYLGIMTRGAVSGATEPPLEAITRAYAIYHELPRRLGPGDVPNYMSRERWEPNSATSLSVHERFMVGMAALGNIGVFDDELPDASRPTGVPPGYFDLLAGQLRDDIPGARFAQAISTDRDGLRAAYAAMPPDFRDALASSLPFQVHPLLKQESGGYLLSSTQALVSWLTRGVHYACLTPLEGTGEGHRFLSYVGHLFEAYAVELMQRAHNDQPGVRVLGEQRYDGGALTSDIAVVDGHELVLLEVEARRFSARALFSEDPRDVAKELGTMVVQKAKQIDRCIDALRREHRPAVLPGVDMSTIDRIRPVVVIEGAIGEHVMLREHLEEHLGTALTQAGVKRLTILTMADLEVLAGFIEQGGHRLSVTLARWKDGSRYRDSDFARFCAAKPDLQTRRRASSIASRWERLTDEVNASFSDEATARLGNAQH